MPLRDLRLNDPLVLCFLPELRLCPSPEMRRAALKRASEFGGAPELAAFLGVVLATSVIIPLAFIRIRPAWIPLSAMGPIVGCVIAGSMMALALHGRTRRRRRIRVFLAECGVPLCINCGYDLRGLMPAADHAAICPECGASCDIRHQAPMPPEAKHP